MRAALILASLAALAGCASVDLSNRVTCTAAGDRVLVASMWGPVGVASWVHADDARALIAAGCGRPVKPS